MSISSKINKVSSCVELAKRLKDARSKRKTYFCPPRLTLGQNGPKPQSKPVRRFDAPGKDHLHELDGVKDVQGTWIREPDNL
ncbi:uncharacterized protein H6S33_001391 [Morchella sextelata]|uniref:uncharacterized protein n=1 Tax=Morchella sextelata TaxID=1174677 RepID=UPI001D04EF13|nr:uncharacterized protein H6S33_001391 [Morchella sextelata]KAH0609163.1 hypothetical protein H6S33_001391 [Morchella sextelata]